MTLAYLAEQDLSQRGVREWLTFEDRSYTNGELHDASCRLATALAARGVGPDDRVIVMMSNCPEVLMSYPAIWRAGAVAVPVLHVLDARELAYILRNSGAKVMITSSSLLDRARAAREIAGVEVELVVVDDGEPADTSGVASLASLVAEHEPMKTAVPRADRDLAVVLYTSGTTGRPKGVMQTHRNLVANAEQSWATAKTHDPDEVNLVVLPLAHSFGLSVLISSYLFGTRAVLMRRFIPEEALRLIEAHRVNIMYAVPTMFMYMLGVTREFDTSSMRMWVVGAAPMPVAQLQAVESRFGGTVYVGYGLTEASPSVAVEREFEPHKLGSVGKPMVGVQVKIVDEQGAPLPAGLIGEICAAGENISEGYLGMPEATAECFRDGWLHTGDLGYLDDDGYLFLVDRKKDLIIRGGLNVYPKDVEDVLSKHPAVLDCAVVGAPDPVLGERVCACVVKRAGDDVSADALISYCQQRLAKYKTPSHVVFLPVLPRNVVGKVLKRELRKQVLEQLGAVNEAVAAATP